jgi:hypothetical protein
MTTAQAIVKQLAALPEEAQREVLDFVEFIKARTAGQGAREEQTAWTAFSLASAMKGMEDEASPYTLDDLKETLP